MLRWPLRDPRIIMQIKRALYQAQGGLLFFSMSIYGPPYEIFGHLSITLSSNECSGEPALLPRLIKAFSARIHSQLQLDTSA